MMSMNNNLKSKISVFSKKDDSASNGKSSSSSSSGPNNSKVSSSISEKIKKLSSSNGDSPTTTPTSITISSNNGASSKNGKLIEIDKVYKSNNNTNSSTRSSRFEANPTTAGNDNSNSRTGFFNRINENIKKNSSEKVAPANGSQVIESNSMSNSVSIKKASSNMSNFTIVSNTTNNKNDTSDEIISDTVTVKTMTGSGSISLNNNNNISKTSLVDNGASYKEDNFGPSIDSSNSSSSTVDYSSIPSNAVLAEEEDVSIVSASNHALAANDTQPDAGVLAKKLAEAEYLNQQLKLENDTLHEELQNIRHEMEELQDQFRLDDADEFRQLQAELEIAAKNCRILQFKLRKLEKRNETLEAEKIMLQDKMDEYSREAVKIIDLEEELLIAKEVSIRLHGELEQAQEWRSTAEKLNRELKKQLDDLKDYLDTEIKSRNATEDYNELVLVNKLYESMFREYFLQEQIYSMSNNAQSQNVTKQLREVTDLISSYQQKIALLNEELELHKQQLTGKDKELEQYRIQLKNLKRSRSIESGFNSSASNARRQLNLTNNTNGSVNGSSDSSEGKKSDSDNSLDKIANMIIYSSDSKYTQDDNMALARLAEAEEKARKQRAQSVDSAENSKKQVEMAQDEVRLLRNKIQRLEDDLLIATQERDHLASQLEKIEEKAMKTFSTSVENDNGDNDSQSPMAKQMAELKKKIDNLNIEAKQNEEVKNQLTSELEHLKLRLKSTDIESESKNHTDEYKSLRSELNDKANLISSLQSELKYTNSQIVDLKKQLDRQERALSDSAQTESGLNSRLADANERAASLNKKLEENEQAYKKLKQDLDLKSKVETELKSENERISGKLDDLSSQLQEKLGEIEFLNRENNALQERVNLDEVRIKNSESEIVKLKFKVDDLNFEVDQKSNELAQIESLILSKEMEIGDINKKLSSKELAIKWKLEEFERNKKELDALRINYNDLNAELNNKISDMAKEIEHLSKDKEQIQNELNDIKTEHEKCVKNKSEMIEQEIDHEKVVLQKLESQALNAKYENKIQYLEVETDTLRSKIRKLLKEKEIQDQVLRENQLLVKEIAMKYATDSESWNRQKQKLQEKEKLYEESVEMRKELKKAADKLRQKLQSLEEQIIEKQNKHTMEKNNWETQRLQLVSSNNKLEEQLAKLATLKRSKKEIETAWDKERKEIQNHIVNLENFVKELQTQLTNKATTLSQAGDPFGQNERIQSLTGENEFLKNRIKELEIMLDEMEQVKRFLFDVKDAYDADRHEWLVAKEEFKTQLEVKENLWVECYLRLNEIVNVIRALQQNDPMVLNRDPNEYSDELSSMENATKNESLNNLVGGSTNLLELKLGYNSSRLTGKSGNAVDALSSPRLNTSFQVNSLDSSSSAALPSSLENSDLKIIDLTKDRKDLDVEFEQAFKKINRVKDNYSTHRKFMDIVKSKSMKALGRNKPTSSLSINEISQQQSIGNHNATLDSRILSSSANKTSTPIVGGNHRAKSMTKEPPILTREDSQKSNDSSSSTSMFNSSSTTSRFFSLTRRIGDKIRFRTSSQPPAPLKSNSDLSRLENQDNVSTENIMDNRISNKSQSSQYLSLPPQGDEPELIAVNGDSVVNKKTLRDRALSPSKFLSSLRARSPFGKSSRASRASSATPSTTSGPAASPLTTTNTIISNKNKGFTISLNQPVDSVELNGNNNTTRSHLLASSSYQSNSINSNSYIDIEDAMAADSRDMTYSPSIAANKILNRFMRSSANQSPVPVASIATSQQQQQQQQQLRSASCEFMDNTSIGSSSSAAATNARLLGGSTNPNLKQVSETNDEYEDNNSQITNSSYSNGQQSNARPASVKPIGSKIEMLRKNFMESASNSTETAVQKSVKFKDPPENGTIKPPSKTPEAGAKALKPSISVTNVDKSKGSNVNINGNGVAQNGTAPTTSNLKSGKLNNTNKARTIDFPDLLQNIDSSPSSSSSTNAMTGATLSPAIAHSKPIQSILRRSETPPNTKHLNFKQTSIDSNDSNLDKLLKSSTSTSRPLMFNPNS